MQLLVHVSHNNCYRACRLLYGREGRPRDIILYARVRVQRRPVV